VARATDDVTDDVMVRRRAVITRAPVVALVDALCTTTTADAVLPIPHGAGRIVLVGGGLGSGRTTALVGAAETCRGLGITTHLLLGGEPAAPDLLDEILRTPPDQPVLLAIDDADVHHRALIGRIAAQADALRLRRVLVLIVLRGTEGPEGAASVEGDATPTGDDTIERLAAAGERITLAPFDTEDLATLVAGSSGGAGPVDRALVGALMRATGGIPRLVDAALEGLGLGAGRDAGQGAGRPADAQELGRVGAVLDDPGSRLRRVADAMLGGLGERTAGLLACLALIDEPVDPALLVAACGDGMDDAVRRAAAQGLLTVAVSGEGGADGPITVAFSAGALRRAAAAHDPVGRPERHLRIAESLARLPGRDADARRTLQHLRAAGDRAPRGLLRDVATAALEESRTLGDLGVRVEALSTLWELSVDDPDRWRELGSTLAAASLDAGRRDEAWMTARTVLRSFDALTDTELTEDRRRMLVTVALAATAGHEYLSESESESAGPLLSRIIGRLGDGLDSVPLLCRAAEIVSMRPHASMLAGTAVRRAEEHGDLPQLVRHWDESDRAARELLDRAERLIAEHATVDAALHATLQASLDVAWSRVHLHEEHTDERRSRLTRALPSLASFDRAWAGTRLVLDALAVGDRQAAEEALVGASPAIVAATPLVAWRVGSVRATLQHARAATEATTLTEDAVREGERAGEPLVALAALVQRTALDVERDLDRLLDEVLAASADGDPHPLVSSGRLELRARGSALRRALAVDAPGGVDVGPELLAEVRRCLDRLLSGGVNRGNRNLMLVLLGRALFHLHDLPDAVRDAAGLDDMVRKVADLLEPYGARVPTDVLGTACFGSSARHLANLCALQGRHDEAELFARAAEARDMALGLDRLVLEGRIDAVRRARLAGRPDPADQRDALLEVAREAERRGLRQLGREARLVAHPELAGVLDVAQLSLLTDLATGGGFREIAGRRGYSTGTMRKAALPVYRALGVSGRAEAVTLAREAGLLLRASAEGRIGN